MLKYLLLVQCGASPNLDPLWGGGMWWGMWYMMWSIFLDHMGHVVHVCGPCGAPPPLRPSAPLCDPPGYGPHRPKNRAKIGDLRKKKCPLRGASPFGVVEGRAPRGLRGFVRFHCACPRDKDRPISSCCLVLRRRPGVSSDTYDTLNEFFSNLILLPIIQIQIPLLITVNHHRQQQ